MLICRGASETLSTLSYGDYFKYLYRMFSQAVAKYMNDMHGGGHLGEPGDLIDSWWISFTNRPVTPTHNY